MENRQNNSNDLSAKVMERIKKGNIKMKPRLYFILISVVLATGFVFVMFAASILMNLVFWHIRNDRPFDFMMFGRSGIGPFMNLFPWMLLVLAVVFILTGFWMSRRYDFSYRRNTVIVALVIALIPVSLGVAADLAGFGDAMSRHKMGKRMYKMRDIGEDWLFGSIASVGKGVLVVRTINGQMDVLIDENTLVMPYGYELASGSFIRAVGTMSEGSFKAKAIKSANMRAMQRNPGRMRPPSVSPMQNLY